MKRQRSTRAHTSQSVTIREVASAAGVSTATVSRVLAGLGGAGLEVRKRVLATVKSLDYEPNRLARGLRARERKLIGILLPDLQNPFFTGVVAGAEQILWEAGYSIQLCHSDGRADREQSHFGVLRGEGIAGLIIIPANEAKADYAELGSWSAPTVAVDRAPRGLRVDLVRITNREGAREATDHLVGLG
jgi:LacI family transcriptional regulator